jgi:hypothetical protein
VVKAAVKVFVAVQSKTGGQPGLLQQKGPVTSSSTVTVCPGGTVAVVGV